jgi:DNA-binding NtrC family response regulator
MHTTPEKADPHNFPDLDGARILLVDDEPDIHGIVGTIVESTGSFLSCVQSVDEARETVGKNRYDIALVDMILPGINGLDLITHLKSTSPEMSIIVITGHADQRMAYSLENAGVRNVLTKPFSAAQLRFTLCKEMARRKLLEKEGALHPQQADGRAAGLIGNSEYIKNLRQKISVFARGEMPVLIQGPTGTGKEVIAGAIHRLSGRGRKTMIVVNSSAIPEHLEESEFFGHARGAFTGAHDEKAGIIECASGSTLFLDEVGELSLRMQAKLLRALDGNGYMRIGESVVRTSDFRLISATNRPLLDMIKEGSFRQDLYFRLKSGIIETGLLTDHREDIPLLVSHFLFETGKRTGKEYIITGGALDALMRYDWPGNVRELKNVVESLCAINVKSRTITAESIGWVISGTTGPETSAAPHYAEAKSEFEKSYYTNLLARHLGNITASAAEAGVDRPNFSKKLKALGIRAADYKIRR